MAENLMKVPVKGILKNSTSFEGSSSTKGSANRGAKWDEMNILATHHPPDKDYGHMKIEEPKTPFSYHGEDSGDEGDNHEIDSKLLTERLLADKEKLEIQNETVVSDDEGEEEDEETPNDKAKRRSFEHKRKSHYNEFMAVKLARQLMQKDEEEVENNEEDRLPEKDSCVEVEETEVDDVEGMDIIDQSQSSS
ncbi:protein phosphatase inhibitor 2-like isoform X2 [Daphnia pulex]|uniref:Protein phosphatase inhibitor 2 n=1 Tax=Daphnia pulex TaxID=6669 RepID=E9GZ97_DAPPU|nr:protein phosphatase inhibitor 2-like isoform X2 [Daphnia pulex]XP_046642821.1 protein phosphatase inhibitor 2-like isoform X2 [Daphnia pulicaria]EFX75109.1 hypothetical protein DAPPUDRAFT_199545 [Daphnia pulex]|eukprot:EFX75109.1 hypothetical protein DAPPUDRAFT_199545 [Daphnia pulex]